MKSKLLPKLKWFFNSFIWLGALFLLLDLISKNLMVHYFNGNQNPEGVAIIPNFLRFNYTINNHFVFGLDLFKNDVATRIVFVIVALGISAGLIFLLYKKWGKLNRFYKACLMMIIAGAIGNSIDRIFYSPSYLNYTKDGVYVSGVVDFIDFYKVWNFHFNVADIAVVVAAIMLIIYMIVTEIIDAYKKSKLKPKTIEDNQKVISKTELEKNKYIEKKESKDE